MQIVTGITTSAYASGGYRCGQIATRQNHFGQGNSPYSSNGTDRSATFRESHVAIKQTQGVRLWYVNFNYNDFATTGGATDLMVRASVEYPVGQVTQVLWGGVPETLMHPLGNAQSDPVMVSIPQGATFYTRTFVRTRTASGRWPLGIIKTQVADLEGNNRSTSTADELDVTMGGSIAAVNEEVYSPFAVMSLEPYKTVALLGDSITTGYQDAAQQTGQSWWSRAFWPAHIPCVCIARTGESAQTFATTTGRAARFPLVSSSATYAIVNYGRNDFSGGRSAAQVQADLQSIFDALNAAGVSVYASTILPRSSSTDAYATTVNQTTDASNAARVTVNTWIRTTPSPCVGFVELANTIETAQDSGIWKAPGYTSDGIHPQPTGSVAMSAAINTSLFA